LKSRPTELLWRARLPTGYKFGGTKKHEIERRRILKEFNTIFRKRPQAVIPSHRFRNSDLLRGAGRDDGRRPIKEGLSGGEGFPFDASPIRAGAN